MQRRRRRRRRFECPSSTSNLKACCNCLAVSNFSVQHKYTTRRALLIMFLNTTRIFADPQHEGRYRMDRRCDRRAPHRDKVRGNIRGLVSCHLGLGNIAA